MHLFIIKSVRLKDIIFLFVFITLQEYSYIFFYRKQHESDMCYRFIKSGKLLFSTFKQAELSSSVKNIYFLELQAKIYNIESLNPSSMTLTINKNFIQRFCLPKS